MSTNQFTVWLSEGDQRKSTAQPGPHALGTQGAMEDGRLFRYVRNGASAMAPGKVYQRTVAGANFDELAIPSAHAAGSTTISVTNGATTVTKDQFKGGWLSVEDDAGEGYNYLIAGNDAEAAGSAAFNVYLADPNGIKVAFTTATTVLLITNKHDAVIIHPSPPTAALVGVATHAMPANYYGWVQTRGECAVLCDTALTAAKACMASTAVDGAAILYTTGGDDEEIIGVCVENAADTEYGLVDLRLE